MICLLSTSMADPSTDDVIEWLNAWKIPWIRLNGQSLDGEGSVIALISKLESDVSVHSERSKRFDPSSIKVVWYRRWGHLQLYRERLLFADAGQVANITSLARHLDKELATLSGLIFDHLSHAVWLSHPTSAKVNKLVVLQKAAECGLDIPATIVTTERERLREFLKTHKRAITKPLGESLTYDWHNEQYASYTTEIDESTLIDLPEQVFPTLLQEYLSKQYDIRVFYLDGRFYGMAIFSQSRAQTSVDFRRYAYDRPVRNVPYAIPDPVSVRLRRLMELLDLETGSIDLVKTPDGRLVFLEVNAVGQFGMVSIPCNYHLEREVASALATRWRNSDSHA